MPPANHLVEDAIADIQKFPPSDGNLIVGAQSELSRNIQRGQPMLQPQVIGIHRARVGLVAIGADSGASRIGGMRDGVIRQHGEAMGIYVTPIMDVPILQPVDAGQEIQAVAQAEDDETTRHVRKRQAVYFVLGDEHLLHRQG